MVWQLGGPLRKEGRKEAGPEEVSPRTCRRPAPCAGSMLIDADTRRGLGPLTGGVEGETCSSGQDVYGSLYIVSARSAPPPCQAAACCCQPFGMLDFFLALSGPALPLLQLAGRQANQSTELPCLAPPTPSATCHPQAWGLGLSEHLADAAGAAAQPPRVPSEDGPGLIVNPDLLVVEEGAAAVELEIRWVGGRAGGLGPVPCSVREKKALFGPCGSAGLGGKG